MLSYSIKKDGKRVAKGWVALTELESFIKKHGGDAIVLELPRVEVLSQAEAEATGKKDT